MIHSLRLRSCGWKLMIWIQMKELKQLHNPNTDKTTRSNRPRHKRGQYIEKITCWNESSNKVLRETLILMCWGIDNCWGKGKTKQKQFKYLHFGQPNFFVHKVIVISAPLRGDTTGDIIVFSLFWDIWGFVSAITCLSERKCPKSTLWCWF